MRKYSDFLGEIWCRVLIHSSHESFNVIEFLNRADKWNTQVVVTRDRERLTMTHAGFPRNTEWSSFHENEGRFVCTEPHRLVYSITF